MNEKILEEHLNSYFQKSSWEKVNLLQDFFWYRIAFLSKVYVSNDV